MTHSKKEEEREARLELKDQMEISLLEINHLEESILELSRNLIKVSERIVKIKKRFIYNLENYLK